MEALIAENWQYIIAVASGGFVVWAELRRRKSEEENIRLRHDLTTRSLAFEKRLEIYTAWASRLSSIATEYYEAPGQRNFEAEIGDAELPFEEGKQMNIDSIGYLKVLLLKFRVEHTAVYLVGSVACGKLVNDVESKIIDACRAITALQSYLVGWGERDCESHDRYLVLHRIFLGSYEEYERSGRKLATQMRTDLGVEYLMNPEYKKGG